MEIRIIYQNFLGMSKTIQLKETAVDTKENSIKYVQVTDKALSLYFSEPLFIQYEFDLSDIPESILNIPYVANLYPICWFLGATLRVKSLDQTFYNSIERVKQEFGKYYPEIIVKNSKLLVENLETNTYENKQSTMLFSGGVDALYTYSKLDSSDVQLVTIHGADIEINNTAQWRKIQEVNRKLPLTVQNPKFFLRSNVRNFYAFKVEKLIYNNTQDWWTCIQHGLALTSLLAPIAYKNGIGKVYIGSTLDDSKNTMPWGSSYIDNFIAWGATQVIHHGQEANRFNKMRLLCEYFEEKKIPTPFRVCYHHLNTKLNCSECTKCYRAIMTLIVLGKDPRNFGFEIESKNNSVEDFYDKLIAVIEKQVFNQAVYFYWIEIYDEMVKQEVSPFIFHDESVEMEKLSQIKNLLAELQTKPKTWKMIRRGIKSSIRTSWFQLRNKF